MTKVAAGPALPECAGDGMTLITANDTTDNLFRCNENELPKETL
jgi:hypothetical protein